MILANHTVKDLELFKTASDESVVIFYHDKCFDGFVSLLTVYCALYGDSLDNGRSFNKPQLVASNYGAGKDCECLVENKVPFLKYGEQRIELKDKIIFIVDYSLSPRVLADIAKHAKHVVWVDHHVSAVNEYKESILGTKMVDSSQPDNVTVMLSDDPLGKEECGASLVFNLLKPLIHLSKHFHLEKLVLLCKRWDLWLDNGHPDSDSTHAAYWFKSLNIHEDHMQILLSHMVNFPTSFIEQVLSLGKHNLKHHLDVIEEYKKEHATTATILISDMLFTIPFCKMPKTVHSLYGSQMAVKAPYVSMTYWEVSDGKYEYSIRSRAGNSITALSIATQYGGGGHTDAAGFTSKLLPNELFLVRH